MKIKQRKELLAEYKAKYKDIEPDAEKRLDNYFSERNLDKDKVLKKAKTRAEQILSNRKYYTVRLTFYEFPMKTDRARHIGGRVWSPNAAANKEYLKKAIKATRKSLQLATTPTEYVQRTYLEMPDKVPPEEVVLFEIGILHPEEKPDWDNTGKCYCDMSTDNILIDDDIIYKGTVIKYYSLLPRVEIDITFLEHHESKYIYKRIKARKSIKEAIEKGLVDLKFLEYAEDRKDDKGKKRKI